VFGGIKAHLDFDLKACVTKQLLKLKRIDLAYLIELKAFRELSIHHHAD
jgi:hypothetical protein